MADKMRSIVFTDAGGYNVIQKVRTDTGAATIQSAILAVSNADYFDWWEGDLNTNPGPSPTAAPYQPGVLKAALTFQCTDFSQVVLLVPAPRLGIFLADGETVNAANPNVTLLIAACIGHLESATGAKAASYLAGTLVRRAQSPL